MSTIKPECGLIEVLESAGIEKIQDQADHKRFPSVPSPAEYLGVNTSSDIWELTQLIVCENVPSIPQEYKSMAKVTAFLKDKRDYPLHFSL